VGSGWPGEDYLQKTVIFSENPWVTRWKKYNPKGLGHVTRTGRTLLSTYPELGPCWGGAVVCQGLW
jgi:hypothetical protein